MKQWKKIVGVALLGAACSQAWAASIPTLHISPTPASATPGSSFGVDVKVSDIADLYAYQFSLAFDPTVLKIGSATLGNFLESTGIATFGDPGTIDNGAGTLSYAFNSLLGPEAGANGSGILMHIDFDALAAGSSFLSFSDVIFLDSSLNDIGLQVVDGSATVAAAPSADVPEPASWLLVGVGLVAAGTLRRRRVGGYAA